MARYPFPAAAARILRETVVASPLVIAVAYAVFLGVDGFVPTWVAVRLVAFAVILVVLSALVVAPVMPDAPRRRILAVLVAAFVIFGARREGPTTGLLLGLVLVDGLLTRAGRAPAVTQRLAALGDRFLSFGALVLVIAVAIYSVQLGAPWRMAAEVLPRSPAPLAAGGEPSAGAPDIYLVLLDSYARADTLAALFDDDNTPFLDALRARGFTVATNSYSNQPSTALTVPSMLAMRNLTMDEIEPLLHAHPKVAADIIASAPGMAMLARHGYETVTVDGGYEFGPPRDVDRYLDSGDLTWAEENILIRSALEPILAATGTDIAGQGVRSRIRWNLDVLPTLAAGRGDPPRFVFDHVFAPHSPQVFGPNGEPRPAITTVEWQDTGDADRPPGDYERAYVGELEYLNGLVLDAVDRLRAAIVRPSVVVLFGDHGSRTTDPSKGSRPDRPLEHFENLFAASTPDGSDDFGPDITLVNLLPTIANRYLGEHLPLSPNLAFVPEADGSVSVVDLDAVPR